MKELAIVKLTKSLAGKVSEKVAAKKKKWAEEAALSVEENKRREAEFKEDFANAKEKLNPDAIKEEIQKGVEATTKKVEELKPKGLTADDITKKAEKEYNKAVNHGSEKSLKEVETKPTPKKEEAKVTESVEVKEKVAPKPAAKSVEKKVVVKKETKTAPAKKVEVNKATKSVAEKEVTKAPAVKTEEKKVETKTAAKKTQTKEKSVKTAAKTPTKPTAKKSATPKKETAKPATKREQKLALYSADITKHYGKVDEDFLTIIVKNLGPSIYRKDAELVSCSDPKELATVKNNFLVKKLKMKESDEILDGAIKEVCEELKASRNKYRATFYYALAKKFKLESKLK